MKKSTLIMASLLLFFTGVLKAEEGLIDVQEAQGSAPAPQEPPLLLAAANVPSAAPANPGVANPVHRLPGMTPAPAIAPAALPEPLITDLTNAPNPFDSRKAGLEGQTQISYSLAKDSKVSIEIYSLLGHKVISWSFAAGTEGGRLGDNRVLWDGSNSSGQKVAKGGYLAQIVIETPETTVTAVRKIGVIH